MPEGEPHAEDTFHWLYRLEPAPEPPSAMPVPPRPPAPRDPPAPTTAAPAAPTRVAVPVSPVVPAPRRRRRAMWFVACLVVVAVVAGATIVAARAGAIRLGGAAGQPAVGQQTGQADPGAGPATSPAPSPSTSGSVGAATPSPERSSPYVGSVTPAEVSTVVASCRARSSTDGSGRRVRYDAELVDDGDPSTAWRCNGDGAGQTLEFRFARTTRIAAVGLVNGYSKVDPASGAHRYGEYRRVTRVTWTFPNGASFVERLQDDVESAQTMRIPVQQTDAVTLTITGTTDPGSLADSRDAVLVSEATFGTPLS